MAHPTLQLTESCSLTPFETRQIEALSIQKYRILRAATVLPTGSQTWKRREEHPQDCGLDEEHTNPLTLELFFVSISFCFGC